MLPFSFFESNLEVIGNTRLVKCQNRDFRRFALTLRRCFRLNTCPQIDQSKIMLDTLISSKTRIKLLLKFFLNSKTTAYLRNLESEFGDSSNAIRLELNKFERAGMLTSSMQGNKKIFTANTKHPLFGDMHSILMKYVGLDTVIENVIERLGDVQQVYLTGAFSRGLDSSVIDLIIIGNIDKVYLINLVEKAEKLVKRKIRYLVYDEEEFEHIDLKEHQPEPLLIWNQESVMNEF